MESVTTKLSQLPPSDRQPQEAEKPSNGGQTEKVQVIPNNDVRNLDSADNEIGGAVEWQIGEDGKLGIGATDNPSVNGTVPNFTLDGSVKIGTFGLEATVNDPVGDNTNLDAIGTLGLTENVSVFGGVENIGGSGPTNTTFGVNGTTNGGVELHITGDVNSNETTIEGGVIFPTKEYEKAD